MKRKLWILWERFTILLGWLFLIGVIILVVIILYWVLFAIIDVFINDRPPINR